MKSDHDEENLQFKMRLDDEPEAEAESEEVVIRTAVDDLRIEKLSQRIAFIGILTPILIVVILSVAYFDIKSRVSRTEDTGAVTLQNMSEDIESRFSTLSLKQAQLDEILAKLQEQSNQSIAKAQGGIQKLEGGLKKVDGGLKEIRAAMVSQSDLKAFSGKLDQNLANMALTVETLKGQITPLAQSVQAKIGGMEQQVVAMATQSAALKTDLENLEKNKIDKAALELALKLEILKFKQQFNEQLEQIQTQLTSMERKISKLAAARSNPAPTTSYPRSETQSAPQSRTPSASGALEEQTLSR